MQDHTCEAVPTRVGVNPFRHGATGHHPGCPHASGGEPNYDHTLAATLALSPREWG